MKHSLDFHILCNDDKILDAIETKLPVKLDGKVWASGYAMERGITFEGNKFIAGNIRFNIEIDRQTVLNNVKDSITPTIKAQILTGSYLAIHACNHDESGVVACTSIPVWSK